MGANVDPVRVVVVIVVFLALVALAGDLSYRVVAWARTGARFRERRLVYAPLAFLMGHGITLTFGGFSFALVVLGLGDGIPAKDRVEFVRCMWVCFAVGPALIALMWVSLLLVRRAAGRSEGRSECA